MISKISLPTDLFDSLLNFGDTIEPINKGIQKQISLLNKPLKIIENQKLRIIAHFEKKVTENPSILAKINMISYLKPLGFSSREIKKIQKEIDQSLDRMVIKKTGYKLDEKSKRMLRNEFVLGTILFALKK